MAIKALNTLVKVHKLRTDVLRREMLALYDEVHQLEILTERLNAEHAREAGLIMREPTLAGFFGAYSASVKKRLQGIQEEMKRIDEAIEGKRLEISEEYSEQKKYEVAREHLEEKLEAEERLRQQEIFDEVGAQQFARKQSENR